MYYPSYEDYMRDVFYFNGLSNNKNMYPYSNFMIIIQVFIKL